MKDKEPEECVPFTDLIMYMIPGSVLEKYREDMKNTLIEQIKSGDYRRFLYGHWEAENDKT